MNKEEIQERLVLLFIVLQFDTQEKAIFTAGERIMINQERGHLLHELDYSDAPTKPVSAEIEEKIKEATRLTGVYDWEPLVQIDKLYKNEIE
ncbi:hypothetical protein [Flavobacterium kingsejongi]|uniref:Uncharacterized protein n=1 Tax=Flavobacterium kingsejongi TaxID=1678728 RepID=A0A2S1LMY8_9FLAO|nr:hypothetical protein [Flavobacterium kingsejongi]AWG24806.1 hypothetical protein FK004_05975 [Flavobacterium kingsejongi]AWG25048.1 hypothetical protein FK004_07280 [Flavobacterium kingsejongi]